ncbi:MAG: DUF4330 family protein [Firmicutes bacterium]|nr:DUF4330 family protein [Bacillota bacterium]
MVDKKGKLFGKINLIDLLILLVLIAAAAYVGLRMAGVVGSKPPATTQLRVSFFSNEVPNYVVDYIVPGTSVFDATAQATLGTVEAKPTVGPTVGYEQSSTGLEIIPPLTNTVSLTLTFIVNAVYGEHGFTIGETNYGVGATLTIFAGEAKLYGKISGIEVLSPAA